MIPPQQTIELVLTRAFPALELAITEPTVATAEMVAAVKGGRGPQGPQGEPGPPGEPGGSLIAGYGFVADGSLQAGDYLEFSGEAWTNKSKSTITDGGNF